MVKCNKCEDGRDYKWDVNYGESTGKWRLWDSDRELPHECRGKTKKKEWKGRNDYSKSSKDLWKKDWKPEMDLPSYRLCGVCNDGTICIVNEDCESCKKFKLFCKEWCPKCKKHPKVILVTHDLKSRLAKNE